MGSICCAVRFHDVTCTNNQSIILLSVGFLMSEHKPIVISNIRDLADYKMSLGLYCSTCNRWDEIVPQEWLDSGKPNINYVTKNFKCEDCGETASKQVRNNPKSLIPSTS